MARIIPSDISPLALAGAHSGELQMLASPIRCPDWVWKSPYRGDLGRSQATFGLDC
jgi:hypothetical protein